MDERSWSRSPVVWSVAAAIVASCLGCAGCDGVAEQEGKQGELQFSYAPRDGRAEFDRPLAVGTELPLQVEGIDEEPVAQLRRVGTDDQDVLRARRSRARSDALVMEGIAPGTAELNVEARLERGGELRSDRIDFDVASTERVALRHTCTSRRAAAYVTEHAIALEMDRFASDGRALVGEGNCPVRAEPSGRLRVTDCWEGTLNLASTIEPGPNELRVVGARGDSLDVHVVSPELVDFETPHNYLEEGDFETIDFEPHTSNWPICGGLALTVTTLTPGVCSLQSTSFSSTQLEREDRNRVSIRAEYPGDCILEVALTDYPTFDFVWEFILPVYADQND